MFKNFTHSQLLKPIFLSTNHFETQIYNQKLSNFRIDLFYPSVGLISPFAVKQCLLPFTLVLIAQRKISVLVTCCFVLFFIYLILTEINNDYILLIIL